MCTASVSLTALLAGLTLNVGASDYVIDPTHTYARFEIDHMGFSTQRGQFNQTRGSLSFDPEGKRGEVDIHINAASIDTGLPLRDDVLRSEDGFNAKNFPDILFHSEHFIFSGSQLTAVEGKLTMLGEARPIRLEVTRLKCGLNLANRKRGCGADATGRLRRSDFGLSNGLPFIGDDVRLHLQIEAYTP